MKRLTGDRPVNMTDRHYRIFSAWSKRYGQGNTFLILHLLLTVHPILNGKRSYFYYFPIFDTDWEKIIFTYRMKTQMDLDGFVIFDFTHYQ